MIFECWTVKNNYYDLICIRIFKEPFIKNNHEYDFSDVIYSFNECIIFMLNNMCSKLELQFVINGSVESETNDKEFLLIQEELIKHHSKYKDLI